MSAAFVQKITGTASSGTISLSLVGVTAGNFLAIVLSYYRPGTTSTTPPTTPTDSNGTVTSGAGSTPPAIVAFGTDSMGVAVWYVVNVNSGAHAVTISLPANAGGHATLIEYSGVNTATPFTAASSNSATTAQTLGTGSTGISSAIGDLALATIAVASSPGVANALISDPPSGYTSLNYVGNTASDVGTEQAYRVIAAAGTQSTTWSWTDSTTVDSIGVIATFAAVAGGGSPLPQLMMMGVGS